MSVQMHNVRQLVTPAAAPATTACRAWQAQLCCFAKDRPGTAAAAAALQPCQYITTSQRTELCIKLCASPAPATPWCFDSGRKQPAVMLVLPLAGATAEAKTTCWNGREWSKDNWWVQLVCCV
jgi:hypothetical protein